MRFSNLAFGVMLMLLALTNKGAAQVTNFQGVALAGCGDEKQSANLVHDISVGIAGVSGILLTIDSMRRRKSKP